MTPQQDWNKVAATQGGEPLRDAQAAAVPLSNGHDRSASDTGAKGAVGTDESWEPPVPFEEAAGPGLPLDAFPEPMAAWIQDVATTNQVSPDLPALIGLGVLAAACSGRAEVQVGYLFRDVLGLYCAAVAEPGDRKGPALRDMVPPLLEAERRWRKEQEKEIQKKARERDAKELRLKSLLEKAAKVEKAEDGAKYLVEAETIEVPKVPALPKILVGNITPEKLEQELGEQGGVLCMASEEAGTTFDVAAGRYAKDGRSQLDTLLMAYDGARILTGRVTRAAVDVERPSLTIILTPQPSILRSFRDLPDFRDRGLLGRFLYVVPRSLVGARRVQNQARNASARQAYTDALVAILDLTKAETAEQIPVLNLTGAAFEAWREKADQLEADQADGDRLASIRDWASKHASRVARIAAQFHLFKYARSRPWGHAIEAETVEQAWRIGDALTGHALVAYGVMGSDPVIEDARAVLAWIGRRLRDRTDPERSGYFTFTHKAAWDGTKTRFRRAEPLNKALMRLVEHGYLRPVEIERESGRGRPPFPLFTVNPKIGPFKPFYSREPDAEANKGAKRAASQVSEGAGDEATEETRV